MLGGIPIFAVGFTQFINREQTDRLVVAIILGPAAVAIYEVAAKLSMLVTQVIGLPISAILPVASRMAAKDDDDGLRNLFVRGSRYITLAVLPIIVALIVLAGPFIRSWFGPGFETSIQLARLLVLAQVFVPLYLIGDLVLMGKGRIALWVPSGSRARTAQPHPERYTCEHVRAGGRRVRHGAGGLPRAAGVRVAHPPGDRGVGGPVAQDRGCGLSAGPGRGASGVRCWR